MPAPEDEFGRRMRGTFKGMLHWEQLDALWQRVRAEPQGWYLSQPGEAASAAPAAALDADALLRFVSELDGRLRREHAHGFCGIVYADAPQQPAFIKIYDPNGMGSFCSCSSAPVLPRWILSRCPPAVPREAVAGPGPQRPWWRRLIAARGG